MNRKLVSIMALVSAFVAHAAPLGTAFTYQGRLDQNGQLVSGAYQMTFWLYAGAVGGSPIASNIVPNVAVANGLFTTGVDLGANRFTGEERWLAITVATNGSPNFTLLQPRSRLAPAPNALYASTSGTVTNGGIRLNQLGTAGPAPTTGQVLGYDGTSLVWTNPSAPGGLTLPFSGNSSSLNALFQINNSANGAASEGIVGSTASSASQVAGVRGVATSPSGGVVGVYGRATNSPDGTGVVGYGGATGGYFTSTRSGGRAGVFDGNVTINGKLEVMAQDSLSLIGHEPYLTLHDSNFGFNQCRIQNVGGSVSLLTHSYLNQGNSSAFLMLHNNGNVGLGNFDANPGASKLQVYGQNALQLVGYQPFLTLFDDSAGYRRGRIQSVNGDLTFQTEAFISGAQPNGYASLNGTGNFSVGTLTIRGGADLAEPFPMKEHTIEKGSVVVIDDEHPGRLRRSTRAYDTRVAGIVSGANGINPGIALKQEGILDQGENVALTGRVYVKADASFGAIRPGDLLTTSGTPGHAMKVTDHARSQGAILGKAMSALAEDKGLVLVLVTLQ